MQGCFFILVLFFSIHTYSVDEGIKTSTRYVNGSWHEPEIEIPSHFYDIPGEKQIINSNNGQHGDISLSVDDVFAGNEKMFTEKSFKPEIIKRPSDRKKLSKTSP